MQKGFFNYKDDDYTDWLNRHLMGVLPEGLYAGFDPQLGASMNLVLTHGPTGFRETDEYGTITPRIGVYRTKQGVMVREDADIILPIATNPTAFTRIDIVVAEHKYSKAVGGTAAVYKVIKGVPTENPSAPTPNSPNLQLVLGTLYVPAGTTALNNGGVQYLSLIHI